MAGITHSTVVVVPDDGTSPVGTDEWNAAHTVADIAPTALILPSSLGTTEGQVDWDTTNKLVEVYDTQRERGVSAVGWTPKAYPLFFVATSVYTGSTTVTANGGSIAIPVPVLGHMLLQSVSIRQTSTTLARSWHWDLYVQRLNNGNSGENTLNRVASANADDSFTATVASTRTSDVGSAPVYLAPGAYWLVIQCTHATNGLGLGTTTGLAGFVGNTGQTKVTSIPNGATLDFVAATWVAQQDIYAAMLNGRVFGQTAAF